MVDMEARMVHFGSDRGGEDIITVTIITTTDITTEDIRDGIVEGIRGGIGKRAVCFSLPMASRPLSCPALEATRGSRHLRQQGRCRAEE